MGCGGHNSLTADLESYWFIQLGHTVMWTSHVQTVVLRPAAGPSPLGLLEMKIMNPAPI